MTLHADIVNEVERLLAEGLSQRKIAAKTGVSRGSVLGIATGRRQDPSDQPPAGPPDESPAAASGLFCGGFPVGCKGCGSLVYLPIGEDRCLACLVRANADVRPAIADTIEPLGIDLVGQHRERYEALHRLKQQARPPDPDPDPGAIS